MSNNSVFGIYSSRISVENAIDRLKLAGFRSSDISILMPNNQGLRELAHEKNTKLPEGTAAGASTGAVIGGTLGWLAGIGALAIPGVGPFIAAGPIMAALAGAGIGGSLGGVTGGLIGLGLPEYEAKRYDGRISRGDILISVHAENGDAEKRAKQILEDTGAEDISSTGEARSDYPEKKASSTY
jgi:hypothetical protein